MLLFVNVVGYTNTVLQYLPSTQWQVHTRGDLRNVVVVWDKSKQAIGLTFESESRYDAHMWTFIWQQGKTWTSWKTKHASSF